MPHKRRKKQPSPAQPSAHLVTHAPTDKLLLTYYKQLHTLTRLINPSHRVNPAPTSLTNTIRVCSLSSDPIRLGDSNPDGEQIAMTEVRTLGRAECSYINLHPLS